MPCDGMNEQRHAHAGRFNVAKPQCVPLRLAELPVF
jgi:hypothetical protein